MEPGHYAVLTVDSAIGAGVTGSSWCARSPRLTQGSMMKRVLITLGLVLFIGGIGLGFLPVSVGRVGCGSAFVGSDYAFEADASDEIEVRCDSARSANRIPAIILLVVGLGLAAAGGVAPGRKPEQATA